MRSIPTKPPALLPALLSIAVLTACGPTPRWYKGNLHTHSYWSDGDQFPEVVLQGYRDRGYDFVALSDHNVLAQTERWVTVEKIPNGETSLAEYLRVFGDGWVEQREDSAGAVQVRLKRFDEYAGRVTEPGRFLVLQAEEISDRFESRPLHVNGINLVDVIAPQGGGSVAEVLQRNIDAVLAQRRATGRPMFPHVNHPNYGWAVTAEDLMDLEGERFFEIYNGHPLVHNQGDSLHPPAERLWDLVLAHRLSRGMGVVYGIAVDDAHNYAQLDSAHANPARGWVVVRADSLAAGPIIAAMESGAFYASTGVVLDDVRATDDRLVLRIRGEPDVTYLTEFVGTRAGYDTSSASMPDVAGLPVTRRYSPDIGGVLGRAEGLEPAYRFTGDEIYVRARILSSRPVRNPVRRGEVERAWTQPVVVR